MAIHPPAHSFPDIGEVVSVAEQAGRIALSRFRDSNLNSWDKDNGTPVSEVDLQVNEFLYQQLTARWSDIGWQSEEVLLNGIQSEQGGGAAQRWVVDPIDGTYAFLRGTAHWGISLALVEDEKPQLAVVHIPVTGATYTAQFGRGARLGQRTIAISEGILPRTSLALACSPTQFPPKMRDYYGEIGFHFMERNSIACRLTEVAIGAADAAISKRTCAVWDIAAAALIVGEAGGLVTDSNGEAISFAQDRTEVNGFIASAPNLHSELVISMHL